jgi:hypothetical protein
VTVHTYRVGIAPLVGRDADSFHEEHWLATDTREQLTATPARATAPEIGYGIWMLEDARRRTRETLEGIDERAIDWTAGDENSIGTLLYHIAAIEADWLYAEVLTTDFPEDVVALFPWDVRDETGRLSVVTGRGLAEHLALLDAVRARLNAICPRCSASCWARWWMTQAGVTS